MVDDRCLAWSTDIPLMKNAVTHECIVFSEWLESMRKHFECAFGVMNGRFCILRCGIRTTSVECAIRFGTHVVFFTTCYCSQIVSIRTYKVVHVPIGNNQC